MCCSLIQALVVEQRRRLQLQWQFVFLEQHDLSDASIVSARPKALILQTSIFVLKQFDSSEKFREIPSIAFAILQIILVL